MITVDQINAELTRLWDGNDPPTLSHKLLCIDLEVEIAYAVMHNIGLAADIDISTTMLEKPLSEYSERVLVPAISSLRRHHDNRMARK